MHNFLKEFAEPPPSDNDDEEEDDPELPPESPVDDVPAIPCAVAAPAPAVPRTVWLLPDGIGQITSSNGFLIATCLRGCHKDRTLCFFLNDACTLGLLAFH